MLFPSELKLTSLRSKWIAVVMLGAMALPVHADTFISPEFSLYVTHNNVFRSRVAAGASFNKQADQFTSGAFEYDMDIGLMPFFRRYLFKDPDAEKAKRVTMRLGYLYLPDLATGSDDTDEHRGLGDVTVRFPLGKAGLLSDRNRFEYRYIGTTDSTRYRNRVRLERNFKFGALKTTPYANGEFYYDIKDSAWNRTDVTFGIEFPWRYRTIMELYYTAAHLTSKSNNETFGITLQKHL